ncbi:MAG: radical SAM family heme chaperone HemW [Gemmatimonadota bacterium]
MHLYVHVPFCARRCSYCDFAIAVRRTVPSAEYAETIVREWAGWQTHEAWAKSQDVDTVYFGGGTPSRISPEAIAGILNAVRAHRIIVGGAEVTLEANPDDVTPASATAWRAAGINRISLGVQSFDSRVLEWMHRTHTAEQVPAAVTALRDAGFDNISLDLIFALPAVLRRDWEHDLDDALSLEPEHLSLYGLTVEPHTPLGHWTARDQIRPLDDEAYARDFLVADQRMRAAGLEHYEVSNAALPGRRARHNSAYWRRAPFIGLGPSAHSGFGRERQWNIRDWAAYQRASALREPLVAGREALDEAALRLEELYLGLRTTDGLPLTALRPATVERWTSDGWATANGRIRLTPEGWLRLDALVAAVG